MKAVVRVLGVQEPAHCFGKATDSHQYPQIATWRCNLTGLSQRNNLFFIAFLGQIHVYKPQFPSQALPPNPALTINTSPSQPDLRGTIDPQNPRAINFLVIQHLGLQEILAVARDDGDVEAYLVAQVVNAVESRASGHPAEVRPFFQRNVGLSAWGLAVHSNARILAASSNTHRITIFKFGLMGQGEDGENMMRRQDVTQVLMNGTTNIPCIAFCNTGDDPDGHWLLTTDVVGITRAFDLRDLQNVQTFADTPSTLGLRHDPLNAGWTVLFLDRRSFTNIEEDRSRYKYDLPMSENILPCPTLHASVKNVFLLQPDGGPIIVLNDPLQETLEDELLLLDAFERINMYAYIPSIGVVILASQKGRALVIGLNRLSCREMPCEDDIAYCMSIDAILPSDQDGEKIRPFVPLLGIAVGPIQGTEHLQEDKRRWRLMMTYYDHTTLSYEIERGDEGNTTVESIVI